MFQPKVKGRTCCHCNSSDFKYYKLFYNDRTGRITSKLRKRVWFALCNDCRGLFQKVLDLLGLNYRLQMVLYYADGTPIPYWGRKRWAKNGQSL